MKQAISIGCILILSVVFCNGQQNKTKPIDQLIDPDSTGWYQLTQWTNFATNKVEMLQSNKLLADNALVQIQLTTNSPLGAVIHESGGILVDHGWIRILGSGSKQIERSLPEWNKGKSIGDNGDNPSYLLIADDVIGGFFAINAGGIDPFNIGKVFYFGPNKLKWETTDLSYNEFLDFCFSGDLEKFYAGFRWKGWQQEISKLNGNEVVSCYPLMWTDAGKDLLRNRKIVTVQEQWDLYHKSQKLFANKSGKSGVKPRRK